MKQWELEHYKECTDYLIKIREDLSDVSLPQHVFDYSVNCPEGIYLMVMELKELLKETETNLLAAYASAKAQKERRLKAEDKQIELEREVKMWKSAVEEYR